MGVTPSQEHYGWYEIAYFGCIPIRQNPAETELVPSFEPRLESRCLDN